MMLERALIDCVRVASTGDARAIAAIYAPYVTDTVISFELDPPGETEMAGRIEGVLRRLPWLVCEQNGQVLGYSYADKYRAQAAYQWSVSVSVYVDSTVHRAGIGPALYASLFRILDLQGCTTCMRVSRYRTNRASDYIALVVFIRSAWSARSASNSVHGMT